MEIVRRLSAMGVSIAIDDSALALVAAY